MPVALEIFIKEIFVIDLEIVADELQRGVVITDHEVRELTHDVDLLDPLPVKIIELPIVVELVFDPVIRFKPLDLHGVIDYEKTALEGQRTDL